MGKQNRVVGKAEKPKFNKIYLLFCIAAIALFFVGRCTGPKIVIDNSYKIDSLNRVVALKQLQIKLHQANAVKAFKRGAESQKAKVVVRTIYREKIKQNRLMRSSQKDSVIKEMFNVKMTDSSRFTEPIANGILDMGEENKVLKVEARLDSTTMAFKDEGIKELGEVINSLTEEGGAKNDIITEERENVKKAKKEARKQKILKWVAVVGLFIVTTLAVSK